MKKKLTVLTAALSLCLAACGLIAQSPPTEPSIKPTLSPMPSPLSVPTPMPAPTPAPSPLPALPIPSLVPTPADDDIINVLDYIPSLQIELRYATADNFTGEIIYDFTDAQLRYGTAKKLAAVQEELEAQGYGLKIWDAYRPVSAQFKLWEVYPDANFVANPNTGYSKHSRGNTVDITMVLADGTEAEMPTAFDDFSKMADRDYGDVSEEAANNASLLESVMEANGFIGYAKEWWHYADSTEYPVI